MGKSFTWFPKLTRTVERVPEEQRGKLLWALAQYGTDGIDPELDYPLDMAFEALRDDIDNSKRQRFENKGGRPRVRQRKTKDIEQETGVTKPENLGLDDENQGSETSKPRPDQSRPDQSRPDQTTGEVRAIVAYLNSQAGKHFRASARSTAKPIKARLAEGYTVDDFKRVIDVKCAEWLGVTARDGRDMTQYLCPETLFGSKFERYLNSQGNAKGGEQDVFSQYA